LLELMLEETYAGLIHKSPIKTLDLGENNEFHKPTKKVLIDV
jgi:hypothetical protein